jgi:hypothetical protein
MNREEGKFKRDFCEYVETVYGAWCKITHGNQYQSGMPDVCIQSTAKLFSLMEMKFWANVGLPKDFQCMHKLMKGAQINVIKHQIWKRNGPCLLVAVIGNDLDMCCVNYKDKIKILPWKHVAKLVAISSDFDTVLTHVIYN